MKKPILIIGLLLVTVSLLSGCTDRSNLVSNDITGTLTKVALKGDKVELTFGEDSHGIITAINIDSDGTNWYNVLKPHEDERIKLTWIGNYDNIMIGYVEYLVEG